MTNLTDIRFDRFRGALLGLAVGDAVGTTLEFKPPGSFAPIDDRKIQNVNFKFFFNFIIG